MKEMLEKKEVKAVNWVETANMLAYVLTKKGGNSYGIKDVLTRNLLSCNHDDKRS